MAPRLVDPLPDDILASLGLLAHLAQAYKAHDADMDVLRGVIQKLTVQGPLTSAQSRRVRDAQRELIRNPPLYGVPSPPTNGRWPKDPASIVALGIRGEAFPRNYRDVDPETAVRVALALRELVEDKPASRALKSVVAACRTFSRSYEARLIDRMVPRLVDEMTEVYKAVRSKLSASDQKARIAATFEHAEFPLTQKGIAVLTRTNEQIVSARGPREAALAQVGRIVRQSSRTLQAKRVHPRAHEMPRHVGILALTQLPNMFRATSCALRSVGWSEEEARKLTMRARRYYLRSGRKEEAFLTMTLVPPFYPDED